MAKLNWACIGIGKYSDLRGGVNAIAYAHAEAMKRNSDDFNLIAGASLEQENLDNFAREYPSRGYLDLHELFAKERLDGCTISTWAPAREEHVMAAINAGVKNILIGPSLPAFVSPNVLKVLVENYNIAPISTPEADLAKLLG